MCSQWRNRSGIPLGDRSDPKKRNGTADNTISEVQNILGGLHWQKDMTESEDGTGNNLRSNEI